VITSGKKIRHHKFAFGTFRNAAVTRTLTRFKNLALFLCWGSIIGSCALGCALSSLASSAWRLFADFLGGILQVIDSNHDDANLRHATVEGTV
jgi:hypothetical protein